MASAKEDLNRTGRRPHETSRWITEMVKELVPRSCGGSMTPTALGPVPQRGV